jgi:hypothetical protein
VAAEFWFSGVGTPSDPGEYGAPNYEYVTTDRLVFHALDADSGAVADAPDFAPPKRRAIFNMGILRSTGGFARRLAGSARVRTARSRAAGPQLSGIGRQFCDCVK